MKTNFDKNAIQLPPSTPDEVERPFPGHFKTFISQTGVLYVVDDAGNVTPVSSLSNMQNVVVVEPTGAGDFTTFREALENADDDQTIMVFGVLPIENETTTFTIDGITNLTIYLAPGSMIQKRYTVKITNSIVHICGFGHYTTTTNDGLELGDNCELRLSNYKHTNFAGTQVKFSSQSGVTLQAHNVDFDGGQLILESDVGVTVTRNLIRFVDCVFRGVTRIADCQGQQLNLAGCTILAPFSATGDFPHADAVNYDTTGTKYQDNDTSLAEANFTWDVARVKYVTLIPLGQDLDITIGNDDDILDGELRIAEITWIGTDDVTWPLGQIEFPNNTPPPVNTGTRTLVVMHYSGTGDWLAHYIENLAQT